MRRPRLIAADLDGTLLLSVRIVSPRTLRAAHDRVLIITVTRRSRRVETPRG